MLRWIVALVLSVPGGVAVSGETLSDARRAELHNLLIQDCGSCHGLTMRGGLGPPLLPQQLRDRPRESLIDTVMNGRPDTAMPPWNNLLSRDEAGWMIDQLRRGVASP
jgi:cytochrome c55X